MPDITYRLATPTDIPAMTALMNAQYKRQKTAVYFQWQYFSSHDPTVSWCAFVGDELVGMFGLQKRRLYGGGFAGQAIDLLIAPQWRGKRIFSALAERAERHFTDIDFLCVLPNMNGKFAVERALGWKTLAKINTMEMRVSDIPEGTPSTFAAADTSDSRDLTPTLCFVYDEAFRFWRFDAHPEYRYGIAQVDSSSFAVIKKFVDPTRRTIFGDIVYFSCDLQNSQALTQLFFTAIQQLQREGVRVITSWALPHTVLYRVLCMLGFHATEQERYFCVKRFSRYAYDPTDITRWHLVEADAEIY